MFSALRSRDFRLLWLGQAASVIGDALVIVAIGLYVTRLTGNPADVGVVLAAYSMPLVCFVLLGGVVADRLPRQVVMLVADAVRGLLHGTLALLIALGVVQVWHMVVIGVLFGTAEAFFQPAYTGLVPQTVDEQDIQGAQALGGVSREIASFASPALATALVLGVGGAAAFGLDALSFAVSAGLLAHVRPRRRGVVPVRSTVIGELREGWLAVRERTWLWATIAAFSASLLLTLAPFFVLGAAVARQVYGSDAVFGLSNAAWGVGTAIGAVVGSQWRPHRPVRAGMLAGMSWPGAISLYAAGVPLPVLYAAMATAGVGIGLFGVWWETAIAQRIPAHLLSRVSAWDWLGSIAPLSVGYLLVGAVAGAVGAVRLLLVGGLLGVVACSLALLPGSTRSLTRVEAASGPGASPARMVDTAA